MEMTLWHKYERPFVVTEAHFSAEWVDGCLVHWPEQTFASASKPFLYVDVATSDASVLAKALSESGKGGTVSAGDPALLARLAQLERGAFRLALRVNQPKELAGLERCPYDAVEVVESMATHDLISRTHFSGKDLFVRIPKATKGIRLRRIAGLVHDRVDVVIAETHHVLVMMKSVLEEGA